MANPPAQPPLLAAIQQTSQDLRVQLAMIFGSMEEGGFTGPWGTTPAGPSVGDYGHSYGPFQLNLPYHPGVTPQQAADPYFAAGFMRNAYTNAVNAIPDSLWKSNPALATEEAAVAAERPAQPYLDSRGAAQVAQTYDKAIQVLQGTGATAGSAPGVSSGVYVQQPGQQAGTAYAQPASLTGGVTHFLTGGLADMFHASGIQDMVERGALIVLGALLIIVGLVMLVKDSNVQQAASQVAGGGGGKAGAAGVGGAAEEAGAVALA